METNEIIDAIINDNRFNEPKNESIYRIKVNKKLVTLESGRSHWTRLGDAKSAFKNHFSRLSFKVSESASFKDGDKVWKKAIDTMQEKGLLEFVEYPTK